MTVQLECINPFVLILLSLYKCMSIAINTLYIILYWQHYASLMLLVTHYTQIYTDIIGSSYCIAT